MEVSDRTRIHGKVTPQRNHLAELGFADLANKGRAMLISANLPQEVRFRLCKEAFNCATHLSNLAINKDGKSRYELFHNNKPKYAMYLREWGEVGTVKTGKNGKVGDRAISMMFVGYAKNHSGDCYQMYNPETELISETRDVMWLHQMYYKKPQEEDDVVLRPYVVLPLEVEDAEVRGVEPQAETSDSNADI